MNFRKDKKLKCFSLPSKILPVKKPKPKKRKKRKLKKPKRKF